MNAITTNGMKKLVFLILTALMVLGAGTVLAQRPGEGFCHGPRLEMLAERLELSDEQIAAIKEIQAQGQEKNLALRKDLMRLRNDLKGEMLKDDPSAEAVMDLAGEIGALRTKMQSNRLLNRLAVREQLTPEQSDKMLMLHDKSPRGEGRCGKSRGAGHHGDGDCDRSGRGKGRTGSRGGW